MTIYLIEAWDGNDTGTYAYAAFASRVAADAYCDKENALTPEYGYEVREMELQ